MGKKKSSFHMGDEFNGNGQKVHLRPTQHRTYTPLSQQGVRLTSDFSQFVPKAIGAIPVGCKSANTESKTALKALGGIPSVSQVMIEKDAKTGSYRMKGRVRRRQLTTGSYPYHIGRKICSMEERMKDQTVRTIDRLCKWLENIEAPYKDRDFMITENNEKIAIKPHNASDGYVTIGFGHAIQSEEDAERYGFETWEKQINDNVNDSIKHQLETYGENLSNPAILTFAEARRLLHEDVQKKRDIAIEVIENRGLDYSENQIDGITSNMYNGTKLDNEESFSYYLLRDDADGAMAILHKAVENNWYGGQEGKLRRRLMEYNIFFNNDYTFYDSYELDLLKEVVGW